jgi:hypothetical protein
MPRSCYIAVVMAGVCAIAEAQGPADWTQWRGPARDGVIASFTAPATGPDALVKRWTVDVGIGYATPIVVGDRVYQFSRIGENETMTALDAASGRQLWQGSYPAEFTLSNVAAAHGKGPKSTPTFFGGRLYTIGKTGTVTAWDAATGTPLWRKPGDPKNVPATTTHAISPLVEGGAVIFPSRSPHRVRSRQRRREMEVDRGWSRLRIASDHRGGWHAPTGDDHTGQGRGGRGEYR